MHTLHCTSIATWGGRGDNCVSAEGSRSTLVHVINTNLPLKKKENSQYNYSFIKKFTLCFTHIFFVPKQQLGEQEDQIRAENVTFTQKSILVTNKSIPSVLF